MLRLDEFNNLHNYCQVSYQFWADVHGKIEVKRLSYIRNNPKQLRTENYIHLQDALRVEGNIDNLGLLAILSSSFTGRSRCMHKRTQDVISMVKMKNNRCNKRFPKAFINETMSGEDGCHLTDEDHQKQKDL
ncbi:hypothetical protein CEXT_164631 [Caerostris extrusa]|uniref:Helitron helicase-like domain-containing protein n=1 Tax=Caerostris extrusa TaxID=172846 RepID=A0AAV4SNK0_CAEEX|nr:hypothetical protein CEXT_164631 [Caerostris extrusa]